MRYRLSQDDPAKVQLSGNLDLELQLGDSDSQHAMLSFC